MLNINFNKVIYVKLFLTTLLISSTYVIIITPETILILFLINIFFDQFVTPSKHIRIGIFTDYMFNYTILSWEYGSKVSNPIQYYIEELWLQFIYFIGISKPDFYLSSSESLKGVNRGINRSTKKGARKLITPLPPKTESKQLIGAVDIETTTVEGKLIPYAIGIAYLKDGQVCEKYFYINLIDKDNSLQDRSSELLKELCVYIESNLRDYTLYTHNLGKFDGYFLIKPFLKHFGPYDLLVDKSYAIISITLPGNIIFKDSIRILPLSLAKLGNLFKTEHRKLDFDHTTATESEICKSSFRVNLELYLQNDCLCLLEVLIDASKIILDKFKVDLHDSYSTSSLAFIVYRTIYITTPYIPTIPIWLDKIIRTSYRGGSVDIYKVMGNQAHHNDVNSLYPHGMCGDMPFEYLGLKHKVDLNKFFGFIYADISVPIGTKVPLVPVTSEDGSLFYPTGDISGLFFSEELKIFIKQGYKVTTTTGYEFSKADLFTKYVKEIYEFKLEAGKSLKANKTDAKGSIYLIYKLLLNGLYGYFGRDPNTLTVIFLNHDQLIDLGKSHNLIDSSRILDDIYLTVAETIPDKTLCSNNGITYYEAISKIPNRYHIKTNVAISSAITSISRVVIAFFKTIPNNELIYSDTDSVFLTYPLDPKYISPDILGIIKDELEGEVITDYLFLQPKLYYYKTPNKCIIKARGVKEGSITVELIHKVHRGETVNFEFTRLYKSFITQTVSEKTINYSVKLNFNRKIPIYDDEGMLIAYKPKHITKSS